MQVKTIREAFYSQLQTVYDRTPRRDVTHAIKYFSASIVNNIVDMETVTGQRGLVTNENK